MPGAAFSGGCAPTESRLYKAAMKLLGFFIAVSGSLLVVTSVFAGGKKGTGICVSQVTQAGSTYQKDDYLSLKSPDDQMEIVGPDDGRHLPVPFWVKRNELRNLPSGTHPTGNVKPAPRQEAIV